MAYKKPTKVRMSSWGEKISEFGGGISRRFQGSQVMESNGLKYVIYALALGIAIAVIILITDNFYPFLPINPISGPSSQARAGKYFWKTDSENLIVPASLSPTVVADTYTMTVQIMIGDSRTPSLGKYRQIVHRGSNPLGLTAGDAGPSGHAGIQESDIPGTDPSYKQTGLPAIMNPGLFLDKYKNDLHVFVHTKGREGNMEVIWLESVTIEDMPLATPLTLGVVGNGKTLEVYVNCRLYSTLILKGTPYLPQAANQWFGRYGAYPMSGLVKNLGLWAAALDASDYIQICRGASFDKNDLPASCPTAK
jgi:hypothetical protein